MKRSSLIPKEEQPIIDEVLHHFKMTRLEYGNMIVDAGVDYVRAVLKADGMQYYDQMISSESFWAWFELRWHNVDVSLHKKIGCYLRSPSIYKTAHINSFSLITNYEWFVNNVIPAVENSDNKIKEIRKESI
jgi:hypothetical protein